MKKTIKTILSMLLTASLMASPCFAAMSYQYSVDDATKTISVTVSGAEKNQSISIQLLKPEKTIKDVYTKADIISDFILMAQAPANANGERTFSASLDGVEAGELTIRINNSQGEKIFYATPKQKAELIAKVVALCEGELSSAKTGLATTLAVGSESDLPSTSMKMLTLTDTSEMLFKISDKMSLYEALYNIVKKGTWNVKGLSEAEIAALVLTTDGLSKVAEDIVSMLNAIVIAADIEGANESLLNIIDKKDAFGLAESYCDTYEKKLSEEQKKSFTNVYFKGKNYLTVEKITEEFEKAVHHSLCTNFKSWGEVEYFIENFGAETGINMSDFNSVQLTESEKSDLYTYILGKSYTEVDTFVADINEKLGKLTEVSSGGFGGGFGGSSGGSGGGSSSGGGGMGMTAPITPVKPVEKEETPSVGTESEFGDLEGFEWAEESISALADEGIVSGTGDDKFEPSRNVTREEMLTMLLRGYKTEIGGGSAEFSDMTDGEWYVPYIVAAREAGFVNGNPDGTFGVGRAITREDAAVMAYRIALANGKELNSEVSEEFADNAMISDYAIEAIYALKNSGILSGKGEGRFEPKANCTRAEAAKIIYMLLDM